jgi:capsular polysaccharide biosynthesis protein
MIPPVPFRAPKSWHRFGKYLLPFGLDLGWRVTSPPREQVPLATLAADYPESVTVHSAGKAEILPEFPYECHTTGKRETCVLPAKFFPPAFVATLRNGLSYGRHCCAIGPDSKALRETGFYMDGAVMTSKVPVSPLRLQHWRKRWQGDVTSRPWLPQRQRLDGNVAVLNTRFSHNFFHWMIDILPRLMPLRRIGAKVDYYLVDCLTPFQQNVLAALGIGQHQLVQPHCRLLLEAEQLLVPSLPTPACLRDFSRLLSAGLGVDRPVQFTRRIFISRRRTGTRTLINENELEKMLHANRFETHFMEQYPLAKQARLIREAEIIVATHGAGLANLLFARPELRIIEIMPAGRFNATCYPKRSRIFGLRHQLVFAQRARHKQILQVSLDDVAAALGQSSQSAHRRAAA